MSPIGENMHSAGASQGVRVVKVKLAMIVFVPVILCGIGGIMMRASSPVNATREPRRAHSPIKPSCTTGSTCFSNSNALGSLVENSQLLRIHLIHQRVLNGLSISRNHVGNADEV